MRVVFRADGNTQIGLGHLTRCLAMAQMLQSTFKITFVCKDIPENLSDELHKLNFEFNRIAAEVDFLQALEVTDIVVLDHYGLGADIQKYIKNIGCQLVCIDDIHKSVFYADLIINHSPGVLHRDYKSQTYTQFALGLDYVLLRPFFLQKAGMNLPLRPMDKVLVCFGGSDIQDLTREVVEILKSDQRFKKVYVVVGAAYLNLESLRQVINSDPRFELRYAIQEIEMVDLMLSAGLVVVPSSGILQEALALQCKVVSGMYAENQKNIFQKFKELGAFESAEMFAAPDIVKAIESSFANTSQPAASLIDGKSGERILKYFKQLACYDKVIMRQVEEDDVKKTFEWASNAEIRRYFFSKEAVDYSTHHAWFQKKLNDPSCFYYIGMFEGDEFGSIRFDTVEDVAFVSYLIDPRYQNKGLGTIILNRGLQLFIEQLTQNISKVCGEVLIENSASIRVFEKLGYDVVVDEVHKLFRFEKIISPYYE